MRRVLLLLTLCVSTLVYGQSRSVTAVKALTPPIIDGKLDDVAWQQAPSASDFIQFFPNNGSKASLPTTVSILYDNDAIYIGAKLSDKPELIRKQLTARDGELGQDVDYFAVFFDTYHDLQNGFEFLVTSANVQSDARLGVQQSGSDYGDKSWDAVWQSQVQILSDGWSVEMRIPYLSLRFTKKDVQTWGLQFLRYLRRNNERSFWNRVDPTRNGFANQFGDLNDLRDIRPPLRLSFSPYLMTGYRSNPEGSTDMKQWLRNGGMDVKYGINESFTLDATLVPDFGQVVSDNIINNLSPFEVRYPENRPFFTEGTELFNKSGLFYSRRIGDVPSGYYKAEGFTYSHPGYQLIRNPSVIQLYNGIKFSGRTRHKLGIGVFNAVTAPSNARFRMLNSGEDTLIRTESLSNYNIIVLDQALRGQSSITFTNANVLRSGAERDANVSALDWSLFSKNNNYQLKGTGRFSTIHGYTPYDGSINLIEDTTSVKGSLMVKPYNGYSNSLEAGKVSGKVQFFAGYEVVSNTYDPNDLGYLQVANFVEYRSGISYNQFNPTDRFVNYSYALDLTTRYLYHPYRFSEVELNASANWVFKNFWETTLSLNSFPTRQRDYFELRTPGKYLERPAEVTFEVAGLTDTRKRLFVNYDLRYAVREVKDNPYFDYNLGLRYRFSNKLTASASFFHEKEGNQRGYAFQREAGGEPIAGFRDYKVNQAFVSVLYNFMPRLNLTVRARHYWNQVAYRSFYNIGNRGEYIPRSFIAGSDENYNAFYLDAFLTWDFRLGSRLTLGYKNWLGDPYAVSPQIYKNYLGNIGQTFGNSHGNELSLKFIYFIDYNQLRK